MPAPGSPPPVAPTTSAASPSSAAGWTLAAVYGLLFGGLAILRHLSFHTHAYDLGLYQQVVWNTAHGRWFEHTYLINLQPGVHLHIADHFELILLPIALLERIYDGPELLLALQAAAVAAAGLLIFELIRRWTGSALAAALFQLLFYLSPAIEGPSLFDFHPILLVPLFLAAAVLAAESDRWALFAAACAGAALCRETAGLAVAALAVYVLWRRRPGWALAVFAAGLAWCYLAVGVVIPHLHPSGGSLQFAAKFGQFGATPGAALAFLAGHPAAAWHTVWDEGRRVYLERLGLHTGLLLPLAAPELLAAGLPELALDLLSRDHHQHVLVFHYSAIATTFLVLAGGRGAGRLGDWLARALPPSPHALPGGRPRDPTEPLPPGRGISGRVAAALGLLAVAASIGWHWRSYGTLYAASPALVSTYRPTPHSLLGARFLAQIPAGAAVSAQSDLAPHLSNRQRIYPFPFVNDADYVLLDTRGETFPAVVLKVPYPVLVARFRADPRFRLLDAADGYLLFRRLGS